MSVWHARGWIDAVRIPGKNKNNNAARGGTHNLIRVGFNITYAAVMTGGPEDLCKWPCGRAGSGTNDTGSGLGRWYSISHLSYDNRCILLMHRPVIRHPLAPRWTRASSLRPTTTTAAAPSYVTRGAWHGMACDRDMTWSQREGCAVELPVSQLCVLAPADGEDCAEIRHSRLIIALGAYPRSMAAYKEEVPSRTGLCTARRVLTAPCWHWLRHLCPPTYN